MKENLLTRKGILVFKCFFYGLISIISTSLITVIVIKIKYIENTTIIEYTKSKIYSIFDTKYRYEPTDIQPNLQVMVESVKRPVKAIESLSINSPIYTVTKQLKNAIYSYESNFSTTAFSKSGNHSGICQMSDKALRDVHYKGNHYSFAKESYYTQDKYCTKRFTYIIKILKNNNIVPTVYKVYTLHQLGYTGGIRFLKTKKINRNHIVSNVNRKNLIIAWEIQTKEKLEKGFNIK